MLIKNPKARKVIYLVLALALLALLFSGRVTEEQIKTLPVTVASVASVAGLIMAALNAGPKGPPPAV